MCTGVPIVSHLWGISMVAVRCGPLKWPHFEQLVNLGTVRRIDDDTGAYASSRLEPARNALGGAPFLTRTEEFGLDEAFLASIESEFGLSGSTLIIPLNEGADDQ